MKTRDVLDREEVDDGLDLLDELAERSALRFVLHGERRRVERLVRETAYRQLWVVLLVDEEVEEVPSIAERRLSPHVDVPPAGVDAVGERARGDLARIGLEADLFRAIEQHVLQLARVARVLGARHRLHLRLDDVRVGRDVDPEALG